MKRFYDLLAGLEPRWSPNLFKAALLVPVILAFVIPVGLVALPFVEFFNGMAAQPKGKAQMTYGRRFDAAGVGQLVARDPVPGTVAREQPRPYSLLHLPADEQGAAQAGELLVSPLPVSVEDMREGQKIYGIYCKVCHGDRGHGDGSVIGPERFPAPPSLHTDKARGYADGALFHILTRGKGNMPSYASKLDEQERWQVIQFLHALQRSETPQPEDLP
ncbi:MAG: cytochrome c [Deltaproteobacteria bacterium]|nr:cytochrome c [Deltaproteobacteria bacterium]